MLVSQVSIQTLRKLFIVEKKNDEWIDVRKFKDPVTCTFLIGESKIYIFIIIR